MSINLKQLSSDDLFDIIMDAFDEGDRKQTKWLLKKATKLFPKHHLIPFIEALLAVTVGDEVKGLKFFNKCLVIKPNCALAHANISACYKNLEQFPKMLHHAVFAVKYATEDEQELVYQQQEMLDMVEKEISNGLSLEQYIKNGLIFDQAYDAMISENIDHAIELFEQVLAGDENLSPALGNLGICYMKTNKLEKSRESLEKALSVDPSYEPAKRTLGILEKIERGEEEIPSHIFTTHHGQIDRNV